MNIEPLTNTITKIVGTSFENRQQLLLRVKSEGISTAYLEMDPANPYDPDAIKVKTVFHNGEEAVLGHIQNGDRLCLGTLPNGKECGAVIDGATVNKSRTVRCPACGHMYYADKTNTVLVPNDPDRKKIVTCSDCCTRFSFNLHNVYVHSCGCSEQIRIGLASRLSDCLRNGYAYSVRILEVTGGDADGQQHSYGCNIRIEAVNSLVNV